jgi:hypothetical protein
MDAVAAQLVAQAVGAVFRAREHERLIVGDLAQQVAQHGTLVAVSTRCTRCSTSSAGALRGRDLDGQRIAQQAVRERADLVRKRGREEQVLALRGSSASTRRMSRMNPCRACDPLRRARGTDAAKGRSHAHWHDRAAAPASRRRGRRRRRARQPAVEGSRRRRSARSAVEVPAVLHKSLADLGREFACRDEHERTRRARTARMWQLVMQASAAEAVRTPRSCPCRSVPRRAGRVRSGRAERR